MDIDRISFNIISELAQMKYLYQETIKNAIDAYCKQRQIEIDKDEVEIKVRRGLKLLNN